MMYLNLHFRHNILTVPIMTKYQFVLRRKCGFDDGKGGSIVPGAREGEGNVGPTSGFMILEEE